MATEGFKRKLTAVFSADFAGYSRPMGDTLAQLLIEKGLISEQEFFTKLKPV